MLSDQEVAKTLKLMTRPAGTKLTPEVARELCLRAGSKAYIAGTVGSLGSEYVLGLKAVNCQSGDTLAQEQVTAASKEKVLDALGDAASKLRGELGESLATVQKFDVPLEHATTSSLEALQAYSVGFRANYEKGATAALPYLQRAIELDPNFAMGYRAVGYDYYDFSQPGRGSEYFTKAFQLREHASARERLAITAYYYRHVTGELDKAVLINEERIQGYPRESETYGNLGVVYGKLGSMRRQWRSRGKPGACARSGGFVRQSCKLRPCVATVRRTAADYSRGAEHENSMIGNLTLIFTLSLFSVRTSGRWRSSNSGLRASPKRTLGWRSRPTPRLMTVIWARHGNSLSELWTPPSGPTARKAARYGRRMLPCNKPLTATPQNPGRQQLRL